MTERRPRSARTAATLAPALLTAVLTALLAGCSTGPFGHPQASVLAPSAPSTPGPTGTVASGSATTSGADGAGTSATAAPTAVARVHFTFTEAARPANAAGASARYPRIGVTGGSPAATRRISTAANDAVTGLVTAFGTQADEFPDVPATDRFTEISAAATRWKDYVTVRIDQTTQLGGAYPNNSTKALIFDLRTGTRLTAATLFTDPAAVTPLVRRALLATARDGRATAAELAGISLTPKADGSTTPLSCYPITAGLACTIDQGSVLPHAAGPLDATLPWASLSGLLRDGAA